MKLAEAPRLPKLPFIIGDVVLVLFAGFVAWHYRESFSHVPLLVVTGCVAAGAIASFIPYLVNYARDQEVAAAAQRHELGEEFKRLLVASEHLQHATVQLKTLEEAAAKSLQAAEKLPRHLQEQTAEFTRRLEAAGNEARESLARDLETQGSAEVERVAALAGKLAALTAEWTKLEAASRQKLANAAQLEERLAAMLAAANAKLAAAGTEPVPAKEPPAPVVTEPTPPAAVTEAPPPAPEPVPAAAMEPPASPAESSPAPEPPPEPPAAPPAASAESAPPPTAEDTPPAKPKAARKPRASRKSKAAAPAAESPAPELSPAEPPAAEPAPAELIAEPVLDDAPAPDDFSQVPPEENRPAAAPSGDGHTRLTVTAYVGIGNKLHLRGDGPGLSWDKGVPLQFVSIGRWSWATDAATDPFTCKLYKNDKIEAPLGTLTLTPGTEQEVTATF